MDEDQLRCAPPKWFPKFLRNEPQIKTLLIRMPLDPSEAFRKCLGIAMFTTRTNFRAAPYRVPGCIRPFNSGFDRHQLPPRFSYFLNTSSTMCSAVFFCDAKNK